jgi:hypothetical protein
MAADCFGNPTPYPPSIADDFASIQRFACVPLADRLAYHYLRTDAMLGRAPIEDAWTRYRELCAPYEAPDAGRGLAKCLLRPLDNA